MKKNISKKYFYYILGFFLSFTIGIYCFIQYLIHENIEDCAHTDIETHIKFCAEQTFVPSQIKFDMFYNHQQFHDVGYIGYFNMAFNECYGKSDCSIHNDGQKVLASLTEKCALEGNEMCVASVLDQATSNNILLFDKTVLQNNTSFDSHGKHLIVPSCDGRLYLFFEKLNDEQKKHLSSETIKICKQQGEYYKKYPKAYNEIINPDLARVDD
jgi:hypothetical protein